MRVLALEHEQIDNEAGRRFVARSSRRAARLLAWRANDGTEREPGSATRDLQSQLPQLYEAHYRKLVKLASFNVDDVETAEEVVQDAFVKLVGGDYDIEAGREAQYLRSMVLNGARSTLRKRRVRRDHTPERPGLVAAAEFAGIASTEHDRVITALRTLPEKQAHVLVLRYYLDLSEAEIADTLGIARGSVKSHAHRGLAKLAVILADEEPKERT